MATTATDENTAAGRVALVTGSGKQRIGWHVADALARRGYSVAVHYHSSAADATQTVEHLKSLGVQAAAWGADLSDEKAAQRVIAEVLQQFGRVDVLINAAGAWQSKPLESVTADDVRHHFGANVLATFLCSRSVGLAMVKQPKGGSIITIGDWAETRPYLNYAAYFATKGAIPTMTRCLAVELATRNPRIRVNCILPGPAMLPEHLSETERNEAIAGTLLKREGTPQNIAQAALALIDNDFITGACLNVDGGRAIYAP